MDRNTRKLVATIADAVRSLVASGYRVYAMESDLLLLSPDGVERLDGKCLVEGKRMDPPITEDLDYVCGIEDSGGW